MLVKTVKVGSRGRVTIPADLLKALGLGPGSELVLVQDGPPIMLVKQDARETFAPSGLSWGAISAPSFAAVWDNAVDAETWDRF